MDNGRGPGCIAVLFISVGVLMALSLIGSDWLYPITVRGEYERQQIENEEYKALSDLRIAAERDLIEARTAYRKQLYDDWLSYWRNLMAIGEDLFITGSYFIMIALGAGVGLGAVIFSYRITTGLLNVLLQPRQQEVQPPLIEVEPLEESYHPNAERTQRYVVVIEEPRRKRKKSARKERNPDDIGVAG